MVQIFRAADRISTPWKNGGGITREVAVWPLAAGMEEFGWRVSIATVSRGGAFSIFPGVDRELAVIEGVLQLAIDGRPAVSLDGSSLPVRFAGDVPSQGEPHGGHVTDLNVMTRRGQYTSRMRRVTVGGAHTIGEILSASRPVGERSEHSERIEVTILIAIHPMTVTKSGVQHSVKGQDAVCLEPNDRDITFAAPAASALVVEISSGRL
jgi:environmental stress-induced protein Ves